MKNLLAVSSIAFIGLCSTMIAFASSNSTTTCPINVHVASGYSSSVVFNAQASKPPLNTYTVNSSPVGPGSGDHIDVPCDASYNIVASPNNTSTKYVEHLPGTYSYIGDPVTIGDSGGVSVTFPNDFEKIQS